MGSGIWIVSWGFLFLGVGRGIGKWGRGLGMKGNGMGKMCLIFALMFGPQNADLISHAIGIAQTTLEESDEEEDE